MSAVDLRAARWIFLRGLAREAGHWGPFLDCWRRRLPETQVVAPDLPGCGIHHRGRSPWSVPPIVDFVRDTVTASTERTRSESSRSRAGDLADAAPPGRRPTAIFAMSLGAMVAYDWVRRYPEEIDGLVLVNGSAAGLNWPWQRLRWSGLLHMARAMTAVRVMSREAHILAMVSATQPGAAGELARSWASLAEQRPVSRLNAIRQLAAAARFRPSFSAGAAASPFVQRSLVLTSLGDRMVNPACSRQIAAKIGAELRQHPTAGHDLPLDAPDWVVEQVADWARLPTLGGAKSDQPVTEAAEGVTRGL